MTSSISFSHKALPVLLIVLLLCAGCAAPREAAPVVKDAARIKYRVAIFPVENLTGGKAPLKELRQALTEKVKAAAVSGVWNRKRLGMT